MTRADRAIRLASALVAAHLAVTLLPSVSFARATGSWTPVAAHLLALSVALWTLAYGRRHLPLLADWLPLALGPFLYIELRWLIPGVGRPHADATVAGWEHALFPSNPSATWAPSAHSLVLSELLHAAYLAYYAMVFVPPLLLYARGRRDAFARTLLALTVVYAACFLTYLVFPVDGPRFLLGPAAAPDGPFRRMAVTLLAQGSSRGTAFPSSHVAASVVASLCAIQFQRRVGIILAVATALLTAGTVYGGFHYAIDALAGMITGVGAWALAAAIWNSLSRDGEQSATAS